MRARSLLKKGTGTSRKSLFGGVTGHKLGAGPLFQQAPGARSSLSRMTSGSGARNLAACHGLAYRDLSGSFYLVSCFANPATMGGRRHSDSICCERPRGLKPAARLVARFMKHGTRGEAGYSLHYSRNMR